MSSIYHLSIFLCLFLVACSSSDEKKQVQNSDKSTVVTQTLWNDCHNCGMPTNDFKNWQARIETSNKHFSFCAPRCMLMTLTDTNIIKLKEQDKIIVTDYYTTQKIDARDAFYVTGSNKTSPMGRDFVPLSSEKDARAFSEEHKGKRVYSFSEINKRVVIKELK